MQNYAEPLFSKGRVLKRESLEALRDFPGSLARLGLADWSDGILFGFDIHYRIGNKELEQKETGSRESGGRESGNGEVVIDAGAVWYQGQVMLTKKESIPFRAYDQQITVCLRVYPGVSTEDFYIRQLELRLKNGEPGKAEFELGRFRLSKGARLRKDYQDLRDCRTAFNTLDITQIPYSGPGGVTVSPVLLRMFARMIMENSAAADMDVQFALLCLDRPPVSRECLLRYICRRLGEPFRELSHSEIYERLVRIAGAGGRGVGKQSRKEGPAVF